MHEGLGHVAALVVRRWALLAQCRAKPERDCHSHERGGDVQATIRLHARAPFVNEMTRRSTATHSAATRPSGPSAFSTLGLTSPIIMSIERIAALCGVLPTLNEKHTCTRLVARFSEPSCSATFA